MHGGEAALLRALECSGVSCDLAQTGHNTPLHCGWANFLGEVCPHFFRGDAVKQKQAKLLLIEALDHFDMINDLFFILRVSLVLWRRGPFHEMRSARFVLLWLCCTYIISLTATACKRYIIYHRIKGESLRLFSPLAVFGEIKRSGVHCPQALFMFERLTWTFQLLMRVVEDLPQLLMSLIFLINNGKDVYAIAVISYSSTMFVVTSIRMGKRYPLKGTLYLLFSSQAPMCCRHPLRKALPSPDDPVAQEAAPTTTEITLFMSFGLAILSFCCFVLALCFLGFYAYFKQQRAIDVDREFLRGISLASKDQPDSALESNRTPPAPEEG
ncbi:hypothetical protein cyc_07910 [Cyclospora cayetanensis]|uniref:Uncharacterized protein n=1 Tax=Cyclospora cayetanensis TaxID=88456 RepID=A0A1D3CVN4_9EIME|nr:hypothetical protein cyc_07910 [Cyclospora cayetanensis]